MKPQSSSSQPPPDLGAPAPRVRGSRRRHVVASRLAAAVLLAGGLSSAFAQSTWTGAVSQDWNVIDNWSTAPSAPTGAFNINTDGSGNYPILNATSSFTPSEVRIGTGNGINGRLDLATDGSLSMSGDLYVGQNGGIGELNIASGASVVAPSIYTASATGGSATATVNVSGTLRAQTNVLRIADGRNNATTAIGTMNVLNGGLVEAEGDIVVAFAGNADAVGTLNIYSGGTVNIATTVKRWFIINQWDPLHGHLNIDGGTLNLNANTDLRFSTGNNNTVGSSSLTLKGGGQINGGPDSVLDLNRSSGAATVNNTVNLEDGTLTISGILSTINAGTRTLNLDGVTLKATADRSTFIAPNTASVINVKHNGVIFDSNGFNIGVAQGLTADTTSIGGGLTKIGEGNLSLSAANTYEGDTVVEEGTLTLAPNGSLRFVIGANGSSNKITGNGEVVLNGTFVFDVTGASTTAGHSWELVSPGLTVTYGDSFKVANFAYQSGTGKWLKFINSAFYEFDPATGVLSVVASPTFEAPTMRRSASRSSYPTGADVYLSVDGAGVDVLSYQWYFKGTSDAVATPIPDATSASYTVTNVSTATAGVYSVVVTDSATPSTPATITFPEFTVQDGTAFTVAYYRFEGDASDSIGSNDLATTGSPAFETDVPFPTIARTGAANTQMASMPASGNHSFAAATDSTLATTTFEDFTIEAFVRFDSLGGFQTIVGRDDEGSPGQGSGPQALFYLSKGNNAGFRVEVITKSNVNLQVNTSTPPVVGTWYHVAVVGNASKGTLTLYVDGNEVGSTTGFDGLFVPTTASDTPWTIGRGDYDAGDVDFLRGDIDEVRFSNAALPPRQFLIGSDQGLIVPPTILSAPQHQTIVTGSSITLEVEVSGEANFQWYKDDVAIPGATNPTLELINVNANDHSGTYRIRAFNTLDANVFATTTAVIRVIDIPEPGRRTIALNFVGAGSGNWSDQIYAFSPTDEVGIYPTVNWNNSATTSNVPTQTTPIPLLESTGSNPGNVNVTWSSGNTWAARIETGAPENKSDFGKLIHGYTESRSDVGTVVTFNNIPYAVYDVYVYVAGGNGGDRVGAVSVDREDSTTYYYRVQQNDTTRPTVTVESPYEPYPVIAEATSIEDARVAPPANFARFLGVSGATLTVSARDAVTNQNAGGIAAIQIIDRTPANTPYAPTVDAAPVSRLVKGGANTSLSVTASPTHGGSLSYQWSKDGVTIPSATNATLNLASVTAADTGRYTVTITENSSLGTSSTTRSASVVVVDESRHTLINVDFNAGGSLTQVGEGILRADGTSTVSGLGGGSTVWNGILGGATSATFPLAKESTGLDLPGLTISWSDAEGAEDNTTLGDIATSAARDLSRDYLYTDNQSVPMTATIGGLGQFAGHRVTLLVYAYGKNTRALNEADTNDTATITLNPANNHTEAAPKATTTWEVGTSDSPGRRLEYNNEEYTMGESAAYVTFTGVVAANGTVSWTVGADSDGGRIPLVGAQLLLTAENLAPAAPTNLVATEGGSGVNLTWNSSAGAQTYTILRSTVSGGPYTAISQGAITGTSYTDTTAVGGITYYYVVSAVAANPVLASAYSNEATVTTTSTGPSLASWRQQHFASPDNSGDGANDADPDGDGLANLLEYAFGTDPLAADGANPVTLGKDGNFLTLSFDHVGDPTLTFEVEVSDDLGAAWTPVSPVYTNLTEPGTITHTDTVDITTQPRRFLRVRVSAP